MRDNVDRLMDALPGDAETKERGKVVVRYLAELISEDEAKRLLGVATRIELIDLVADAYLGLKAAMVDDEDEGDEDEPWRRGESAGDLDEKSAGA